MASSEGYKLQILDDKSRVEDSFNRGHAVYVPLTNGQEYKIRLVNNTNDRVEARLNVDGKDVGRFRINAYSEIDLERPAQERRKFEFYKETSRTARKAGVRSGAETNGLIEATFVPEVPTAWYEWGNVVDKYSERWFGQPKSKMAAMQRASGDRTAGSSMVHAKASMSAPSFSARVASPALTSALPVEAEEEEYSSGATVLGDRSNQSLIDVAPMNLDEDRAVTLRLRLIVNEERSKKTRSTGTRYPSRWEESSGLPRRDVYDRRYSDTLYGLHYS